MYSYKEYAKRCPDPVISLSKPDCNFSAVPESLEDVIEDYLNQSDADKSFRGMVYYKYMTALSAPGDGVGVLAAQVNEKNYVTNALFYFP